MASDDHCVYFRITLRSIRNGSIPRVYSEPDDTTMVAAFFQEEQFLRLSVAIFVFTSLLVNFIPPRILRML